MSSDRLSLYREAMELESDLASIESDLARVSARLTAIHRHLASDSEAVGPAEAVRRPKTPPPSRKPTGRARRGELRTLILQALQHAGGDGIRVQPLAESIGAKPVNVYSWFQIAAKNIPQIEKIGRGLYRWYGPAVTEPIGTKRPKTERKRRSGKHGALKAWVEKLLRSAGSKGMTIRDLAAKIGVKHTNLSVWFSTTGKKNKAIKKVAPGHYKLL